MVQYDETSTRKISRIGTYASPGTVKQKCPIHCSLVRNGRLHGLQTDTHIRNTIRT